MKLPTLQLVHNATYASLFPRYIATMIDMLIYSFWLPIALWYLSGSTVGTILMNSIMACALIIFPAFILSTVSKIYLLHTTGQTLGKMIVGIEVLNDKREKLTWKRIFFRELIGKTVSGSVMCLGYFSILFDKHHQGWHDHFVNSFVYEKKKSIIAGLGTLFCITLLYSIVLSMSFQRFNQQLLPSLKNMAELMQSDFAVE